jgi:hypothetical protein
MPQRSSTLLIANVALVSLAAGSATMIGPARSADECTASPNRAAPAGQHWYFRRDPASKRQCWFLAAQGAKVQKPVTPGVKPRQPEDPVVAPAPPPAQPRPATTSRATTAAGGGEPGVSDSALQLRWPDPGRYTIASSGTPEPVAAEVPPADEPGAAAQPAPADTAQVPPQVAPALPYQRVDPPVDSRVSPHEVDHTFALVVIVLALLIALALVWCLADWQRRRVRVERAGHLWLAQWRANRSTLPPEDVEPAVEQADALEQPQVAASSVVPFDWAQQFANAWQELSQEASQTRAASVPRP